MRIAFVVYDAATGRVKRSGSCQEHALMEQAGEGEAVSYHDTVIDPNGRFIDLADGSLHPDVLPPEEPPSLPPLPQVIPPRKAKLDPMGPEKVSALRETIAYWKQVERGEAIVRGPGHCPLCKLYYAGGCKACPVQEKTGFTHCRGPEYWGFVVATKDTARKEGVARVTDERGRKAAEAVTAFLEALLPSDQPADAELGGTYSSGTVSVTNASAAVTGSGVLWVDVVEGDWLTVDGVVGIVDAVNEEFDEITLKQPWAGATAADAPYLIVKMSWLRYDPALTQAKLRELLAKLDGTGTFYFVEGAAPDPGIGLDGQFALKVNTGSGWKLWFKVSGAWELQTVFTGIHWRGGWDDATAYVVKDAVERLGIAYVAIADNANFPPESNPAKWDLFAEGGDRYEIIVDDAGRPAAAEVMARVVFTANVSIPEDLVGSRAVAAVASTSTAVFSVRKNNVQFGTITFSSGNTSGVVDSSAPASFVAGDVLTVIAPSPRDATLSGIAINIVGGR